MTTSTLLGYELYANNMPQSLRTLAAEPENKNAQAYYDANIGSVKTVDDFINNYRLFSYAMSAYGLSDLTYAKGLMKKVLTSDLSSSTSVANQLSDPRYKAFAEAFNFSTTGAVQQTSIQSSAQQSATVTAFKANETDLDDDTVDDATTYYTSHIGSVTSFADLEKDPKLYQYVLTAYGVDPGTPQAQVEQIVEGSLSDPNSVLNTTTGAGYGALHNAFNVGTDGTVAAGTLVAQTSDQTSATIAAYANSVGSDTVSQNTASAETTYFGNAIANVTNVSQLISDPRLLNYVVTAYNLPSSTTPDMLDEILTSDPNDPTSLVNSVNDPGYKAAAQAFNFASDGSLKANTQFQTSDQQQSTVALYASRSSSDTADVDSATQYYEANIGSITSVSQLQQNTQLYDYVLKAYGLDSSTPESTVADVLEQDPTSSTSTVATTDGSQDLALQQAFDLDGSGNATDVLTVQSPAAVTSATNAYMNLASSDSASQTKAKTETAYYTSAIAKVTTVGALLSDSRLVSYVETAYGIPTSTTTDKLRQVLTSDLSSSTSVANTLGGAYQQVAQAFTFNTSGLPTHQSVQTAQNAAQIRTTDQTYLQQALETEAGQSNAGVQLALYLQRKGPTITNAYQILADSALTKIFQTYLGLPSSTSSTDIDQQAAYITSKINFKDLQDPTKLTKMVQSFAARYDVANPDTTEQNTIAMLFGGGSSDGS